MIGVYWGLNMIKKSQEIDSRLKTKDEYIDYFRSKIDEMINKVSIESLIITKEDAFEIIIIEELKNKSQSARMEFFLTISTSLQQKLTNEIMLRSNPFYLYNKHILRYAEIEKFKAKVLNFNGWHSDKKTKEDKIKKQKQNNKELENNSFVEGISKIIRKNVTEDKLKEFVKDVDISEIINKGKDIGVSFIEKELNVSEPNVLENKIVDDAKARIKDYNMECLISKAQKFLQIE